ncbi:MAG: TIGR03620 family F420-dependent LLM class oxidoreductase [Actinomycetota bacterium]|nr:TIGR03620 family F420-dependent LLM class oxidoreductase [Actinomycetota bacterium]
MSDLSRLGFWLSRKKLPTDPAEVRAVGAQLDELGVASLWLGTSPPADLAEVELLLDGSERLRVGTSITNIWFADPAELAASSARVARKHPGRGIVGIGIGHAPSTIESGQEYVKPLARLTSYLDALDAAPEPVPPTARMLAALGPKTLALAASRTAGSLPYLTTPEHTARARAILGPGALLVPEHAVVIDTEAPAARDKARAFLRTYLALPNYVSTWLSLGFTEDDIAHGGSDRLVDALVLHGSIDDIVRRLREHLEAGADEVAAQPVGIDGVPTRDWRDLAAAFAS